jgi:hypothetical protein
VIRFAWLMLVLAAVILALDLLAAALGSPDSPAVTVAAVPLSILIARVTRPQR